MKSLNCVLFILSIALPAGALPVANPNSVDGSDVECGHNGYRDFHRLIHKAGVMGDDDRDLISLNAPKLGLSEEEIEQAMQCTGRLVCPTGNGTFEESAGSFCPPGARNARGHCAADRITLAAHIFVDPKTNRFRPNLAKCRFENYRRHSSELVTEDLKVIKPQNAAQNPRETLSAEAIVIRLKKPVPNCDPYDLGDTDSPPPKGTDLISITYPHGDQIDSNPKKYSGKEPVAFACKSMKAFNGKNGNVGSFYSDCDATPGASGGFNLTRRGDGRLGLVGVIVGSDDQQKPGTPYNEALGVTSLSISTNADFRRLANQPGKGRDPVMTENQPSRPSPTSP